MPDRLNVPDRSLFTGDNLKILRCLNSDSVDLIYVDPPRNTGELLQAPRGARARGFRFEDKWTADDTNQEWEDEIAARQPDAMYIINAFRLVHDEGMVNYLVFLTIRLLELQRVLKPSGSIYLHCRADSAHCIKAIMDTIFGSEQFKNDIAFGRYGRTVRSGGNKRWKWAHDKLLFYAGPRTYTWHSVLQPHPAEYFNSYPYKDERGKYQTLALAHRGSMDDDRGTAWGDYDPGANEKHWQVPLGVLRQHYPHRNDLDSLTALEKLELLEAAGMIEWPKYPGNPPRYKKYEDETVGDRQSDMVATISNVHQKSQEGTGWPAQVPEGLLEIIISASTDEQDIMLDPFAGSGTACVVAERLKRRWVGIETAPQGFEVLDSRLRRELKRSVPFMQAGIMPPEIPRRTDIEKMPDLMSARQVRRTLYARQSGKCKGCEHELPFHVLTLDLVDKAQATDIDDLQLLCHFCRVLRGAKSMDYLTVQTYAQGVHKSLDTISY